MIVNGDNGSTNFYTEGFGVSFPEPFSIKVDTGNLCYIEKTGVHVVHTYPEFEFDVEVDANLPVVYDVQLLEDGSIQIDRTEIGEDSVPFYTGEILLQHTLLTFVLLPTDSLDTVEIKFNNVLVVNPDEATSEQQTSITA